MRHEKDSEKMPNFIYALALSIRQSNVAAGSSIYPILHVVHASLSYGIRCCTHAQQRDLEGPLETSYPTSLFTTLPPCLQRKRPRSEVTHGRDGGDSMTPPEGSTFTHRRA